MPGSPREKTKIKRTPRAPISSDCNPRSFRYPTLTGCAASPDLELHAAGHEVASLRATLTRFTAAASRKRGPATARAKNGK